MLAVQFSPCVKDDDSNESSAIIDTNKGCSTIIDVGDILLKGRYEKCTEEGSDLSASGSDFDISKTQNLQFTTEESLFAAESAVNNVETFMPKILRAVEFCSETSGSSKELSMGIPDLASSEKLISHIEQESIDNFSRVAKIIIDTLVVTTTSEPKIIQNMYLHDLVKLFTMFNPILVTRVAKGSVMDES